MHSAFSEDILLRLASSRDAEGDVERRLADGRLLAPVGVPAVVAGDLAVGARGGLKDKF